MVNNIGTLILKGSSTVPSVSHAGTPDEASDKQTVGGTGSVGWSDDMTNTNPVRRFVMTENFDWDIYPVCESDETYTLEVYADPEEGGMVTVSPLKEEYHMDERVDLVATPAEGWRFAGWHSRYWSDSGRDTSVDIYRDMTIEARFVEIEGEGE